MECHDALNWVGERYSVRSFAHEAERRGCCRKIASWAPWLKPGTSRVFLAHRGGFTRKDKGVVFGYFELAGADLVMTPGKWARYRRLCQRTGDGAGELPPEVIAFWRREFPPMGLPAASADAPASPGGEPEPEASPGGEPEPEASPGGEPEPEASPDGEPESEASPESAAVADLADFLVDHMRTCAPPPIPLRGGECVSTFHSALEEERICGFRPLGWVKEKEQRLDVDTWWRAESGLYLVDVLTQEIDERFRRLLLKRIGTAPGSEPALRDLFGELLEKAEARSRRGGGLRAGARRFERAAREAAEDDRPRVTVPPELAGHAGARGALVLFDKPYPSYQQIPQAAFQNYRRIDGDLLLEQITAYYQAGMPRDLRQIEIPYYVERLADGSLSWPGLLTELARRSRMGHNMTREALKGLTDILSEELADSRPVRILDLGRLYVRRTKEKTGIHPITGETIVIPARNQIRLKVAAPLKRRVNPESVAEEPEPPPAAAGGDPIGDGAEASLDDASDRRDSTRKAGKKEAGKKEAGKKEAGKKEAGKKEAGKKEAGKKEAGKKEAGEKKPSRRKPEKPPTAAAGPSAGDPPTVLIPLMIQDPPTAEALGIRPADGFLCKLEESYYDGPASDRVAVLDFDPETGALVDKAVRYVPPKPGKNRGKYDVPRIEDPKQPRKVIYDLDTAEFMQASVFGTVLRTMKLFEDKRVLGRKVSWAFDGPQLLVVPRAGEHANAFYERDSRSLQLFFFHPDPESDRVVYTSLSRDIVAHETAHAILDGIAPDLYHALSPESLALHEAVADLTAVMLAAESSDLITAVMKTTGGALENSCAFSSIAQQFGAALNRRGKAKYLRQLVNDKTLKTIRGDEPHELCLVLGGALFSVLMKMHEQHRQDLVKEERWQEFDDPWYACSGAAFTAACFRLRNIIFPALDYLPPGEVSFADYGRAILAVDGAGNLNPPYVRQWIIDEFRRRGIVDQPEELDTETNVPSTALDVVNLEELIADDDAARRFAEANRELLRIPADVDFRVSPRQVVERSSYDAERNETLTRECLFKVRWRQREANTMYGWLPVEREVRRGTTLSIDLESRRVRTLLTSDPGERQRAGRDRLLLRLVNEGLLQADARAPTEGEPRGPGLVADTSDGVLRVRGTGRLLHIAE